MSRAAEKSATTSIASKAKSGATASMASKTKSGVTASMASKVIQEEEPMEEETEGDFIPVDRLTNLGINATDVKKLKEGGFHTVASLLMSTKKNLMNVKGLSEAKVLKMLECCGKLMTADFITGTEAREKRKNIFHISTGASQLDELLGGGVESASITEGFGEFRTGKTQLSHTLCVTAQLPPELGGSSGRVAFIDTENTFRPEVVAAIAERFELNADDVLDNIIVARAFTSEHQIDLLPLVAAKMTESPFGLLIVDSATALFRVDYSGRGELSERQQKLNRFLSGLTKIAEQFNVAVWITNQVMATPDAMAFAPTKPVGGHVLSHASTTRLSLRKGRGEQRICKIFDSPMLGEGEATFEISAAGVTDPTD